MSGLVRVLSDLHLGHKVSRIERVSSLRPLVAGAGTVIFNGDTWQELADPFRERSAAMLGDLKSLCQDEGAEPVFLPGNHDPGWPGAGWVELAGGRIVVTHGDALLPAGSPWKREIITGGNRVAELWERHPGADRDPGDRHRLARHIARDLCSVEYPFGRSFIQRAWDAAVPPRRAFRMIEAWISQGENGARFCERYFPKAEALVIGHFHWPGCWRVRGRLTINTGSFVNPGRAQWVEWSDGWLTRGEIEETADECRIGRTLDVWRLH
jgi:predicted phosphodiesterase